MNIVLVIAFLVTLISGVLILRLALKINNLLSFILPIIIALIITEIVYVIETMFYFNPNA